MQQPSYEVEFEQEPIELCKLLKILDVAQGGGEAKQMIINGEVSLNGEVEWQKRKKIYGGDTITVAGATFNIVLAEGVEPAVRNVATPELSKPNTHQPAAGAKKQPPSRDNPFGHVQKQRSAHGHASGKNGKRTGEARSGAKPFSNKADDRKRDNTKRNEAKANEQGKRKPGQSRGHAQPNTSNEKRPITEHGKSSRANTSGKRSGTTGRNTGRPSKPSNSGTRQQRNNNR